MPRRPRIQHDALLDALLGVFCEHGFEGASLSLVSQATGLRRASLYHRFPDGKTGMALAVLERVQAEFGAHVLAPLAEAGPPAARVRRTAQRLAAFYRGGARSCVLETLSLGRPEPAVRAAVQRCLSAVLEGFAAVAREAGATPAQARRRAELALARYQGALVLARAGGDRSAFERAMRELPAALCGE